MTPGFRTILAALLTVLGAGVPVASTARADSPPGHPAARRFSTADGLPHDTVYTVARDAVGYLWIGTQYGAARYDGRRFATFDMPDAATSNYVRDILATRDGGVWFARQNGGVVRLREGRTTVLGTAQGLTSGRVNTLAEAPGPDGRLTVYAGLHAGGVCRLDGDRFVPVPAEAPATWRVWKLAYVAVPGHTGPALLAASEEGLLVLEKERFVRVPLATGPGRVSFNSIASVSEEGVTTLYLGSYGAGVLRWNGTATERLDTGRGLPANLVTALAAESEPGEKPVVWVGTRGGGLARIEGGTVRPAGLDPRANEVFGLATGLGDGAVWVCVRAFGLVRLARTPFSTVDGWSGLPSDAVSDIRLVQRPGGAAVWIGTNRGLGVLRDGVVTVLDAQGGLPSSEIGYLATTGDPSRPDVWVGTLATGLVRFRDGAPVKVLDVAHGFVTDRILALLGTPEGLWLGTDLGKVLLLDTETGRPLVEVDGLPRNEILNLARSADGTLWAATRSGLAVVRGRAMTKLLTHEDGLPSDEILTLTLVPGASGEELWAGTRGGVARAALDGKAGGPARFTPVPGLPAAVENATVQVILPDGRGNVYLGTHRGIVRLALDGSRDATRVFTTADGVPSNIANWGGFVDAAGRVWISTSGGVAVLDPSREPRGPGTPAPLVIQSLFRNDRLVAAAGAGPFPASLALRHDESLSVELALLCFSGNPGVTYRAQLVGLDGAPSAPAAAPVFRYSRLPAGSYVFRAWGRDSRGVESHPVELPFSVAEAPWRTAPALALYLAGVVLAVAGVFRLRTRTLQLRALELEALVDARTRELVAARDQALAGSRTKDAFLANVSHELRTPLNAILGYAELLREELPGRADDALEDVTRIRTAAEMQLGLVNEILDLSKIEAGRIELHLTPIDLDDLVASVASTVRPLVARNGNRLVVTGSPGAGELFADRPRLAQVLLNLLSNAAKFTTAGTVTLAVSRRAGPEGEEVAFEVSDTGIGMTPQQLERLFQPFLQAEASTSATYGGTGLGLVIAQRFCQLMGGDIVVASEPGKGSRFTAWVPVRTEEERATAPGGAASPATGPPPLAGTAVALLGLLLSAHTALTSPEKSDIPDSPRPVASFATRTTSALPRGPFASTGIGSSPPTELPTRPPTPSDAAGTGGRARGGPRAFRRPASRHGCRVIE